VWALGFSPTSPPAEPTGRPVLRIGVLVGKEVELVFPREGRAECPPEVLRVQAGQMKRHPEQVGCGRRHRAAQFVLREALELVQYSLVEPFEVTDEVGLQLE
jgi:hypothetical protein